MNAQPIQEYYSDFAFANLNENAEHSQITSAVSSSA